MNNTADTQRVVVIGGTSGIGFAVARAAATQGSNVVVASSSQDRVDLAVKKLGDPAEGIVLDVADDAELAAFFDRIGEFDHLVYTAGESLLLKPLADLAAEESRVFFERRFWGAVLAAKYATPKLRPGGSITFTSGAFATRPAPGASLGASVTAAVEGLTRALALELAPLRVNAVRLGAIRTELWDAVPEPEAFLQALGGGLPVRRVGTPEEAAAAYLYLLGNGYATGTVLTLDGGAALA
ncbi:short-chain dehydrogenase [Longispora fulva]|uniref:NAD(P)-dependent dehydrogenase (Short-subunit alcohol dehydrogenase family) n=1 Tax=Longispora fulva TaxID=619741 RepID=A0A8J7GHM7_9ACTN|nr:SDR family oxidoreductase [Longispora fulva]MBG6136463.1 NAD(P)-dependent dehydrogenase (short-subunit alcohol dehydrogenase family) [Longispora fulva]GIG59631.1 short-chain dehydrogenase [Longispora fulva]